VSRPTQAREARGLRYINADLPTGVSMENRHDRRDATDPEAIV
jgi:hypothetical protein